LLPSGLNCNDIFINLAFANSPDHALLACLTKQLKLNSNSCRWGALTPSHVVVLASVGWLHFH